MPFVSVVMPTYNCANYIEKAISSVLIQSFDDFELIIIDDGSVDETVDIINTIHDDRIRLIENKSNKGIIYSLNIGLMHSKGKFIARMDADDISLSNRFEKQIEHLNVTNADICGCHFYRIDEEGTITSTINVPLSNNEIMMCLGVVVPFAHPSVMIRKSFLDINKLSYGKGGNYIAEDLALWLQMAAHKAVFTNVDKYLFKHRHHNETLSATKKKNNILESKQLTKDYILGSYEVDLNNINNSNDRTQKLIIRSMIKAAIYKLDCKYLKGILKFKIKNIIFATIVSFFGNDLSIFNKDRKNINR